MESGEFGESVEFGENGEFEGFDEGNALGILRAPSKAANLAKICQRV